MITNRRLKTAVAGLGRIAWQYHMPEIIKHRQFQLSAVADPIQERLHEAATEFGITAGYQSVPQMLEAEKPDLLVIASPTCFHTEQVLEAFKCGTDVICEKPLACTIGDAGKIRQAMHDYQRKLMVYQPHRLTAEAVILKNILESGVLGRIFMVRRTCCNFSRRNDWQAFSAYGGGMLNNYGSHFIDQFIYLFGGSFKSVNAVTRRIVSGGDAEDFVKLLAVNGHDITFDLEINMAAAFHGQEWLVCGDCGSAAFHSSSGWRMRYFDPAQLKSRAIQPGLAAEGRLYPSEPDISWTEKTIASEPVHSNGFYDCCYRYFALNEAPLVPVENSVEVMETLERCRQAAPSAASKTNSRKHANECGRQYQRTSRAG